MTNLKIIEERFEEHLRTVDELISFDKSIMDHCIGHLESLNDRLKGGLFQIRNPDYLVEGTLKTMKNVRSNDSLRIHYSSMYNSCLVLQVSYFTSIIGDIFKHTTQNLFSTKQRSDLDIETLKQKNDINFQNMHSTIKTYKKYLDVSIEINTICNTIILAQSSRHAIVHSLGMADQKFITQTNLAKPRDIKHNFNLDEKIQFSASELNFVKIAMQFFISELCDNIRKQHQIN